MNGIGGIAVFIELLKHSGVIAKFLIWILPPVPVYSHTSYSLPKRIYGVYWPLKPCVYYTIGKIRMQQTYTLPVCMLQDKLIIKTHHTRLVIDRELTENCRKFGLDFLMSRSEFPSVFLHFTGQGYCFNIIDLCEIDHFFADLNGTPKGIYPHNASGQLYVFHLDIVIIGNDDYAVTSRNDSSMEYTWMSSGAINCR